MAAAGLMSEAFERIERAQGALYTFRDETMLGRRHVLEAELKQRRRTHGRPGHEAVPDEKP